MLFFLFLSFQKGNILCMMVCGTEWEEDGRHFVCFTELFISIIPFSLIVMTGANTKKN